MYGARVATSLTPELAADLQRLVADLAGRADHGDLAARLEALIDLLVVKGVLTDEHRAWIAELQGERNHVKLSSDGDKHAVISPDVDCAALLPLCKGRCCSFNVTLSREDVLEGKLRWELRDPYALPKHPTTGYCCNMRPDGGCTAYHDRPATCRSYDCRSDPRVWLDYEQRVPAPLAPHLIPLGEWPADE